MLCISREMLLHLLWKRMHQHFLSYCFSSFLLRFKSSASTARQFSVCARNLSNAALGPTCRRSVQTVAWDERTPGLRVKPVEGLMLVFMRAMRKQRRSWDASRRRIFGLSVRSSFPWCIELCNCGGRRLPQNQEQEARHLQTEAWTPQWHACPWRMLTDAALMLESQEERCRFGCLQPRGC